MSVTPGAVADRSPTAQAPEAAQSPAAAQQSRSVTPTLRQQARAWRYWVFAGIGVLAITAASIAVGGGLAGVGAPLAADNAAPGGAQALAEVLRQQGVTVTVADTLAQAETALESDPDSTLFLFDPDNLLGSHKIDEALALAPRLVIADPGFAMLDALGAEVGQTGVPAETNATAGCSLPAAERAESVTVTDATLGISGASDAGGYDWSGCFDTGDGAYVLVEGSASNTHISLVASREIFQNDTIAITGNAALALNLLGESEHLVWYLPTIDDVEASGPPSLAELTPGWVTPAILLLLATLFAAMIWKGRRLGPLVAERLPVVVKSGETMEGRARLYSRQAERGHALDSLRIATIGRLASALALSRTASTDEVSAAVSALLGRDPLATHAVLIDSWPATDAEMLRISDGLLELESAVHGAIQPISPAQHDGSDTQ